MPRRRTQYHSHTMRGLRWKVCGVAKGLPGDTRPRGRFFCRCEGGKRPLSAGDAGASEGDAALKGAQAIDQLPRKIDRHKSAKSRSGTSMPSRLSDSPSVRSVTAHNARRDWSSALVLFAQDVELVVVAAEGLRQAEGVVRDLVGAALLVGRGDVGQRRAPAAGRVRQVGRQDLAGLLALCLGLAQDRLDAHGGILQVGAGLALEAREAVEVEDVVRVRMIGEVGELQGGEADRARDLCRSAGGSRRRGPVRSGAIAASRSSRSGPGASSRRRRGS